MQTAPIDCVDDYDKVLVEQTVRGQSDLPMTILRYPAVYGRNDYHRFGPWLAPMFKGAPEVKVPAAFAAWRWTHGYADDVAEATVCATWNDRAAGRVYNVGEEHTPTWAERLAELAVAAEWQGRIVTAPDEDSALDLTHHLVTDTTRIRQELGYREIVPREEGFRRTVEWERG